MSHSTSKPGRRVSMSEWLLYPTGQQVWSLFSMCKNMISEWATNRSLKIIDEQRSNIKQLPFFNCGSLIYFFIPIFFQMWWNTRLRRNTGETWKGSVQVFFSNCDPFCLPRAFVSFWAPLHCSSLEFPEQGRKIWDSIICKDFNFLADSPAVFRFYWF